MLNSSNIPFLGSVLLGISAQFLNNILSLIVLLLAVLAGILTVVIKYYELKNKKNG